MDYSNIAIVANVAIPYSQKVDDTNLDPKQITSQDIHSTQQNDLQTVKDPAQQTIITDSFPYSPMTYQELQNELLFNTPLTYRQEYLALNEVKNTLTGALINIIRKNQKMRMADIMYLILH